MNDYKKVTEQMHSELVNAHAGAGFTLPKRTPIMPHENGPSTHTGVSEELGLGAKIDRIHPDSPAYAGGLRSQDIIMSFGDAKTMTEISECVSAHANTPISVKVKRESGEPGECTQMLELVVTPSSGWGEGRQGLLGCHIVSL